MYKLLYLTNIPAPYRIKRFNDMASIFSNFNIAVEVMFCAKTEPDRNWIVNENDIHFNYKIWPGIHPSLLGMYAHFNPSLLLRLTKKDYDIIIIGGMSFPTLILAPFFVNRNAIKLMSVESNLKGNTTAKTGFRKWLKGRLLSSVDAFQITGQYQKDYIQYFSPAAKDKPYVILPNLIDGKKFAEKSKYDKIKIQQLREKYGIPKDTIACLIPARFVDIKYPEAFLKALPQIKGIHFVLAGAGPLEEIIREITKNLSVTMLPYQQEDNMIEIYGASDVFCLPSTQDASPLSTIEACCCSLPLLISKNVGNMPDVLVEGENGFSFNPYDQNEIIKAFDTFTSLSLEKRNEMRHKSFERYMMTFENEKCLKNYAESICTLLKNKA